MADANELKKGLIISIDNELWFLPLGAATLDEKIAEIKTALVGGDGKSGAFPSARKLSDKEQHDISGLATEEIRDLLSRGITIRPMGR